MKEIYNSGLVIGKFNPPHIGHQYLIETALSKVRHLYIIVCDKPEQTISGEERKRWLEVQYASRVTVLLTDDDLPAENRPWAARVHKLLKPYMYTKFKKKIWPVNLRSCFPEVVFTSEPWGQDFAQLLKADHVMVDLDREKFPISGTKMRKDLLKNFNFLLPSAKHDLVHKVVLVGAESSGKTTLAKALAQELKTAWVPEFGRTYWEGRQFTDESSWNSEEFHYIAYMQQNLTERLSSKACNGVIILDTDPLVTYVWHERYLGYQSYKVENLMNNNVPDLYIVCKPDFGWVQDGTRESENYREHMQNRMEELVRKSGARVETVEGSHEQRLEKALSVINEINYYEELI